MLSRVFVGAATQQRDRKRPAKKLEKEACKAACEEACEEACVEACEEVCEGDCFVCSAFLASMSGSTHAGFDARFNAQPGELNNIYRAHISWVRVLPATFTVERLW